MHRPGHLVFESTALLLAAVLLPRGAATAPHHLSGSALERHVAAIKRIEAALQNDIARRGLVELPGERAPLRWPGPASRHPIPAGIAATPANVKLNDSTGDASIATQSEEAVAAWGDFVLAGWNDGQGSFTGGAYLGYATSVDGGQTFADGGDPPKPAAFPSFRWTSDPVIAVNPKSGLFYYCGLANTDGSHNAIAVARGSFAGGGFAWLDVQVVREEVNTQAFLDKPWIAADSSGAGTYVYLANTTYTHAGNQIDFTRSTDGGATWGNPTKLSSNADAGFVQGARPVVGPGGEVYVVWNAIGQGVPEDFFRLRRSTNRGQSFAAEVTAASYIANFGTGGPGYSRERGIHWPSVAVDRTAGADRGRVYLAFTEAYNFQDDPLGAGVNRVEIESNDFTQAGTPFTPGDVLRGATSSVTPPDLDYWSFALVQGQSIVVHADSLPAGQTYALSVFAGLTDSTESLTFGGDIFSGSSVQQAFYTFTAPLTSTYFLRMGPLDGSSKTGGYRVRTGYGVRGSERGRDQRDVFVSSSDDGATWSAPVRVNDDPVGLDDYLAEVAVGADGCPYVTWYDYRDQPYGTKAHQYVSRSGDGGATWAANQRLTAVATAWQHTGSNLAPNMGDYAGLSSDVRWLHVAWADGRDGSADVYGARIDLAHGIAACALDATVPAGTPVTLAWQLQNPNDLFANDYGLALASARAWSVSGPATVTVPAGSSAEVQFQVQVPDTASPGVDPLTFTATNARGTLARSCVTGVTVTGPVAVGEGPAAFGLGRAAPNPARGRVTIGFSLPEAGPVTLRIFGLGGERVRTLADGVWPPGRHQVTWDGRDPRGRPLPSGAYFYRLESAGRSATRRLVWIRS